MTSAAELLREMERPAIGTPRLVRLSDVTPEAVRWLSRPRIPAGKLTDLSGDPGLGKSTLTAEIAARCTLGAPVMPGDSRSDLADVVILSAEDGAADTIRPRIDAAGGDPDRVRILEGVEGLNGEEFPVLPLHLRALQDAVEETGAQLVIVDPLAAYLGAGVNSRIDHDVRRALAPLAKLAEETGAAVVVVRHLNKSSGTTNAIYRGGGSIAFIGAARCGLLVAADPEDPNVRILAQVKNNLAPLADSLRFRLVESGNGAARIEWLGTSPHTANALLAAAVEDGEVGARDEARAFLEDLLRENGHVSAKAVQAAARNAGIAERTLRRAKEALGVRAEKTGFGGGAEWVWRLPTKAATTSLSSDVAALGTNGHLHGKSTTYDVLPGRSDTKAASGQDMDVFDSDAEARRALREGA